MLATGVSSDPTAGMKDNLARIDVEPADLLLKKGRVCGNYCCRILIDVMLMHPCASQELVPK